jgi:putative NIF3 family GTP cyclohydrolase 1 type 2
MRGLLILVSLFLLHLSLVARCALVADPQSNILVTAMTRSELESPTSVKLLPTASNGYAVYWYDNTTSSVRFSIGGTTQQLLLVEGCVKFNVKTNPTRNSVVFAAILKSFGATTRLYVAVVTDGIVRTSYNEPGIPVVNEPGLAFINSTTFVVTYETSDGVKRRSATQSPQVKKSIAQMSLTDFWLTSSLYSSFGSQTGGSVAAINDNNGDWLAVWDDQGAQNVLAYFGSFLTPSSLVVISDKDGSQLHTPVVAYPFVAYVGNSGTLYVALVSRSSVLSTYNVGPGSEPHLFSMNGTTTNVIVLSYVRASNEICIRLQSVQYKAFSSPICWSETSSDTLVTGPSSLILNNGTIVVSYVAYTATTIQVKTQVFAASCGDLVISPNEECDGEKNCATNCVCKPMSLRTALGYTACAVNLESTQPAPSIPIGSDAAPNVVPLLDCYVPLNESHVRGYFSYENLGQETEKVQIGSTNRFAFKISSDQDVGQPIAFAPGRSPYFPASSFAVTWDMQSVSWFLTNYQLAVNPSSRSYVCPQNVSVDIDVSISKLPNATELEQFAAQIAAELGVDPARVVVTVSQSDGGFTITITIIGNGAGPLTSAVIAEKLVDVIKNKPQELEDSVKNVLPIDINSGSVRGKPDAVTGQRGELSVSVPSTFNGPNGQPNTSPKSFNIVSFFINLFVLVLFV